MHWHRPALVALSLSAAVFVAAGCTKNAEPPAGTERLAAGTPAPAGPPLDQIAPDLPPLPRGFANAPRPVEVVKAAYEFAARHPEVLNYVPCYCGCERGGHKGNHDCFIAGRDEAGNVTDWDVHGLGCDICIDVAYEARQMHESGASVAAIRTAIDKRYAGLFPTSTPTPMPPGHGGHDQP
jgi:hypothetical protein